MNESEQYHWESMTFRDKYEAVLYYVRAVLDNIMKQPKCTKIIRDKCLNTVDIIDTLLLDYNKWYNNSYGNFGKKKDFFPKDKSLNQLLNNLMEIDIFEH